MGKVFGFLLAVALTVSSANAALLLRYDFTNGTGGTNDTNRRNSVAEFAASGLSASEFASSGSSTSIGININQTAPGNGTVANPDGVGVYTSRNTLASTSNALGDFSLGFDPLVLGSVNISKVVVRYRSDKLLGSSGSPSAPNTMSWSIGGFDGVDVSGSSAFGGTSGNTNSGPYVISTYNFSTPYVYSDSVNPLGLSLSATRTGTTSGVRMQVDYIEFYGQAVPEPASMAIFGAMGLGLVARRFRKK
jgi:hypothetical protein